MLIVALISGFYPYSDTPHASAASSTYYVATNGNDSWSGTLAAPNGGGTDGPFKTIQKARDVVSADIAGGMSSNVTVYIRGGNYYQDEPITFTEDDSGRNGYTVTYQNYQNEEPVILGGEAITGWSVHSGNIYKASIDDGWVFNHMSENGVRAVKARFPNTGYKTVTTKTGTPYQTFGFTTGDIPSISNLEDVQISIWPGGPSGVWNWFENIIPVHSIDYSGDVVTLRSRATSWTSWSGTGTAVTGNAYKGTYSLEVGLGTGSQGWQQDITFGFAAGASFTLSGWGKYSGANDYDHIGVKALDSSGSQIGSSFTTADFSSTSYEQKSVTFTVPTGTAKLRVYTSKSAGTGYQYYDDLSLVCNSGCWPEDNNLIQDAGFEVGGTEYEMGAGSRYFVQGALELLDAPGEFYVDSQNSEVYYYPRNTPISSQLIIAPKVMSAVQFKGSSTTNLVKNIIFDGITVRDSDILRNLDARQGVLSSKGIIFLTNAENITISNCKIYSTGNSGIDIFDYAKYNVITGNLLYDIGGTGIDISSGTSTNSTNNQISNNYIHTVGQIIGHGAGIELFRTATNTISYNRLDDGPRFGISLFQNAPNNTISYNDLSDFMKDSQDGGPIYMWNAAAGNQWTNNMIHDSNIHLSYGFGFYVDAYSDGQTITDNLIYGLQKNGNEDGSLSSVIFLNGDDMVFENNIVANNDNTLGAIRTIVTNDPQQGLIYSYNHKFTKNIVYDSAPTVDLSPNYIQNGLIFRHDYWNSGRVSESDYNTMYNSNGVYNFYANSTEYSLAQWQSTYGFDTHSSVGQDPLFVDPSKADYRLKSNSPAYAKGFEDINAEPIGLLSTFKYADTSESLDRLFIKTNLTTAAQSTVNLPTPGSTAQISVSGRTLSGYLLPSPISGATVSYSSSDTFVATVSSSGLITAVSAGTATITATVTKNSIVKTIVLYVDVANSTLKYEVEDLSVYSSSGDVQTTYSHAGASNGEYVLYNSNAVNDHVAYTATNFTGTSFSHVKIGARVKSTRGTAQLSSSADGTNYYNIGSPIDFYNATEEYQEFDLGPVTFGTQVSTRYFKLTVTGKNGSSTDYSLGLDYLELVPTAPPLKYESENMTVYSSSGDVQTTYSHAGASNGEYVLYNSNAVNDHVAYTATNFTGTNFSHVKIGARVKSTRGTAQLSSSADGTNYYNIGSPIDFYNATEEYQEFDLGPVTFGTQVSTRYFKLTVTGKNGSSTDYSLGLDYLEFTP